jgi:hypothetical protein
MTQIKGQIRLRIGIHHQHSPPLLRQQSAQQE